MREGLLYGIGFLSAFLSGVEIGFFLSVFLETTAMASIVHRVRAPMLLAKVACFSVRTFLGTLGLFQYQVATYLFLSLCEGFSSREATDPIDLS